MGDLLTWLADVWRTISSFAAQQPAIAMLLAVITLALVAILWRFVAALRAPR